MLNYSQNDFTGIPLNASPSVPAGNTPLRSLTARNIIDSGCIGCSDIHHMLVLWCGSPSRLSTASRLISVTEVHLKNDLAYAILSSDLLLKRPSMSSLATVAPSLGFSTTLDPLELSIHVILSLINPELAKVMH